MNRTKQKHRPAEPESSVASTVFSLAFGLLAGAISFVALTLIFSLVALLCPDPHAAARIFGYATLYLSSAVVGFASCKRYPVQPIVRGLTFGVVYALINWLIALLPGSSASMGLGIVWVMRSLVPVASVAGSLLASYKPKRKPVRRKRR